MNPGFTMDMVARVSTHLTIVLILISSIVRAQSRPSATTTLAAETGNNTSASPSFSGMQNGTPPGGNVSKVPINTMLYKNASTRVYAHWMGWFGAHDHLGVGYRSDDREQIHRQVEDMISRGFAGVIATWDGHPTIVKSVPMLLREAERHAGFTFAFELEDQYLKRYRREHGGGNDMTQGVLEGLAYGYKNFEQSPAYLRVDGRPVVLFFGGGDYSVDWDRVHREAAGNPLLIFRNPSSFDKPYADGAFAWIEQRDPNDEMLSYLERFYGKAVQTKRIAIGSAWAGFDDRLAEWSKNRVTPRNCGRTWVDTFAEVNRFYSERHPLGFLQVVTWNDYEEGTSVEPGIDNCLNIEAKLEDNKLRWSVHGGSEETLSFYKIFISTDGQNLAELTSVPTKTHAIDLGKLGLPTGSYTLFVKAVGRPSILNHMSNSVGYAVGLR